MKRLSLDWENLVEPALRPAADGFTVDEYLSRSLKGHGPRMESFPEFGRVYRKPNGSFYEPGDQMLLSDLAWSLEKIRGNGRDGFYRGEVAERLVADVSANGGIIKLQDLADFTAPIRQPIHGTYCGYDVYGMPPLAQAVRFSCKC